MDASATIDADVVILGGGCAGVWLLDELRRRGARAVLLEAGRLGSGQTANSQGILHGGLKYSLAGIISPSARMVRDMPAVWQASLAGRAEPDLSAVKLRGPWCHLWRSGSVTAWAAMLGATMALAVKPVPLADGELPPPLVECPKPVYRLDEPVIDPLSFLEVMAARNRGLVWKIDAERGLRFENRLGHDERTAVLVVHPETGRTLRLLSRYLVLSAGEGNARLREQLGLNGQVMQRRPLRVALVRGPLPQLNGHCVEGTRTKVTITSAVDAHGRTVWQLGGQLSEDGVGMETHAFLRHARAELAAALSGWQAGEVEWTAYCLNRAEGFAGEGLLPSDVQIVRDGPVITAWPTKLVLAPRLGQRVLEIVGTLGGEDAQNWRRELAQQRWPAPAVACAPWEEERRWSSDV
jgi:glycine/D-amino acid oxidase-like deaminating enzyme